MKIKIGDIFSIRTPESYEYKFDDRQERIKVIDGMIVQDRGRVPEGDVITCTAVFNKSDFEGVLTDYWINRSKITFQDEAGKIYENMVFSVKSYKYYTKLPNYVIVTFEIDKARRKV